MIWSILGGGDIRTVLIDLLLALPACLLAISAHESAHGWVAMKCGDPTAYNLGRITLNPVKHFDPIGTTMLILLGFGWARPVPVNPRNFKHYRRDDLLVALAGITMNLILALISSIVVFAFLGILAGNLKTLEWWQSGSGGLFITEYKDMKCVIFEDNSYLPVTKLFEYAFFTDMDELFVSPAAGRAAGLMFRMLTYFVTVNLSLAFFNLLPIPPLDGYHLLNDTILRRPLFARFDTERITRLVLLALIASDYIFPRIGLGAGILSRFLNFVLGNVLTGLGKAAGYIYNLFM